MVVQCNLSMEALTIYIPYFDINSSSIIYTPQPSGFLQDSSSLQSQETVELYKAAWLNKANPDWKTLLDASSAIVHSGVTGSGTFSDPLIANIDVEFTHKPDNFDNWYTGTSGFGIYGTCQFGDTFSTVDAPFLNNDTNSLVSLLTDWYGLKYNFKLGAIANITTLKRLEVPWIFYVDAFGSSYFRYPST